MSTFISIFLYRETLRLGQELGDKVIEAQACFSLGNCYTLLHNYQKALEYHLRHYKIAQELADRIGEGRGCWSISNSLSALGRNDEALEYALRHKNISIEINDSSGKETAEEMINNITKVMKESKTGGKGRVTVTPNISSKKRFSMDNMELLKLTPGLNPGQDEVSSSNFQLNLLPDNEPQEKSSKVSGKQPGTRKQPIESSKAQVSDEPDFLDMIASFQKDRMEDQRCQVNEDKENTNPVSRTKNKPMKAPRHPLNRSVSNPGHSPDPNFVDINEIVNLPSASGSAEQDEQRDDLLDLIAGFQSERMADQRAALPAERLASNGPGRVGPRERCISLAPGNHNNNHAQAQRRMPPPVAGSSSSRGRQMSVGAHALPDDDFFDMLMRCQASRLEDQRSQLPENSGDTCLLKRSSQCAITSGQNSPPHGASRSTVPDDDFFSLIVRFQAGRIDDQRSSLPAGSGCVVAPSSSSNITPKTTAQVTSKPVKSGRRSFYKSKK